MNCEGVRENIPALTLDALEPGEVEQVRDHIESCAGCRQEYTSSLQTRDVLNYSVPDVELPAGFTQRLVARASQDTAPPAISGSPKPGLIRRLPWALALAACVAIAVLGYNLWNTNQELAQQRDYDAHMSALMARPDIIPVTLQASHDNARGRLYLTPNHKEAVLMVSDLPKLPSGQVYQLWLTAPKGVRSVTTFHPLDNGAMRFYLWPPDGLDTYQSVEITVEPSGGSPTPSGQNVITGKL